MGGEAPRGPTRDDLIELAERWEVGDAKPVFRKATCVSCAEPMIEMWHLPIDEGSWKKEIHLCRDCGEAYGLFL